MAGGRRARGERAEATRQRHPDRHAAFFALHDAWAALPAGDTLVLPLDRPRPSG